MKIDFKEDYKPGLKYGGRIYSKIKIKRTIMVSPYQLMTIIINPNTEFKLLKTDDGQIMVERNKNGIKLLWEITFEELNKYFKRTYSKATIQEPIEL